MLSIYFALISLYREILSEWKQISKINHSGAPSQKVRARHEPCAIILGVRLWKVLGFGFMLISLTRARSALRFHRSLLSLPHSGLLNTQHRQQQRGMADSAKTAERLNQEITQQSALLNDLRKQQADSSAVEEVKKKLGDLKRALGQLKGGVKEGGKKKERILLKTAKVSDHSSV